MQLNHFTEKRRKHEIEKKGVVKKSGKKHTHTHILQTKCGGNLNKSSILAHTVACLSVMYRLALCPGYC